MEKVPKILGCGEGPFHTHLPRAWRVGLAVKQEEAELNTLSLYSAKI